jgi:DNA integrity scanning protein DisA with diadenylate cyclase activity
MAIKFAVYKIVNKYMTKDGHTMMPDDVARDLNRKSYLESVKLTLDAHIAELQKENKVISLALSLPSSNESSKQQSRIAELEKELSNAQTMSDKEQSIRDLEQQAKSCDWIYSNVPDLSNGNYIKIKNRSAVLRNQAKALKEGKQ